MYRPSAVISPVRRLLLDLVSIPLDAPIFDEANEPPSFDEANEMVCHVDETVLPVLPQMLISLIRLHNAIHYSSGVASISGWVSIEDVCGNTPASESYILAYLNRLVQLYASSTISTDDWRYELTGLSEVQLTHLDRVVTMLHAALKRADERSE